MLLKRGSNERSCLEVIFDHAPRQKRLPRHCLELFRSEGRKVSDAARLGKKTLIDRPEVGQQAGAAPAEWAFVPGSDLLLLIGEGLIGLTVEGAFAQKASGQRLPFASAIFQTMM